MAREVSVNELLNSAFDYQIESVYTALPGIIITVRDELKGMSVDVQPSINIKDKSGIITERPPILNVPLHLPTTKRCGMTFTVERGDPVMLIFSMKGLDIWKRSQGYPTTPSDYRKFDKRDAVAIPGILPFSESPNSPDKHLFPHNPNDLVIFHALGSPEETEIRIKKTGGVVVNTHQDVEVNCRIATVTANEEINLYSVSMNVNVTTTTWNGNIVQNGNYTLGGVLVNTHTHPDPQGGSVGPMQ